MNVIRTIPQDETQEWVNLLFDPNSGQNPPGFTPLDYPFPVTFRRDLVGGFLYVRYRGEVIGYGKIAEVRSHSGETVGEENTSVPPGDSVILAAPLSRMPFVLAQPGGFRWKYVEEDLHQKAP